MARNVRTRVALFDVTTSPPLRLARRGFTAPFPAPAAARQPPRPA